MYIDHVQIFLCILIYALYTCDNLFEFQTFMHSSTSDPDQWWIEA